MSAWLCSEFHINALVTWGCNNGVPLPKDTRAEIAKMLVDENMRSLAHRYDDVKEWAADAATYTYQSITEEALKAFMKAKAIARPARAYPDFPKKLGRRELATQIVMACQCFDYQACETDDYEDSEAARFVRAVRVRAIACGGQTKGKLYDAMLWGLD